MLLFNGREVQMAAELPPGTHNARPFRDGVLFNDTEANAVRYAGRGEGREDRALPRAALPGRGTAEQRRSTRPARSPGLRARSLRAVRLVVAGGSSPSTISVYDLAPNERLLSVNLTMDVRNAIHGLEVWPFD